MIGKTIYQIRRKRGYTLSELAERTRISKSYLSNIERNININPSIEVIKKIAKVLEVDLKTLIGTIDGTQNDLDSDWIDFVNELKESGIEKELLHEYKPLIEFIKWKNDSKGK
ncbi:helix-turn-helix domain-containing protein [Neobacillus massiliamazoniensis]|uniref:XRE family transcriptional regulator n=1 Tax=Neobacillus massiliamazoniensis TaxID=1499688 RepID=A0A0U1NUE5_9BACI|nr:helix-turn-helix transcriptional regulator [Neobacillus massiliamazoniensis]CRK81679.1 XRE family transcriptional regulator [Neobacillus massiliamazoniensis]